MESPPSGGHGITTKNKTYNSQMRPFLNCIGLCKSFALVSWIACWACPSTAQTTPNPQLIVSSSAAVTLGGQNILFLRTRILSLSAQERAQRAADRVGKVADDSRAGVESIKIVEGEMASDIVSGDFVLMSVTDSDGKAEKMTRQELAERNAGLIKNAIASYRKERSSKRLIPNAFLALFITLLLVFLIKGSNRFCAKKLPALDAWARARIPNLRIQHIDLIPADHVVELLVAGARAAHVGLIILALYIFFPLVFSLFPWTQGLAAPLFGYVLSPLKAVSAAVVGYVPNLFFIAVILFVVRYFLKIIRAIFLQIQQGGISLPGFYEEWAQPTYEITRFLVGAFTAVVVFPYLPGSSSPAFKGVSVFLGILLSLGSSSAISNIIAGVILTYMRPFKLGDRVKISDTVGDVVEKTLLVTRVSTIKNVEVTIPNAMVLSSHIVNYSSSSKGSGLILHTGVTIGYDAPWRRVHELLIAAAEATEYVEEQPAPFVLQTSLNDFYVSYELNAHTNAPNKMALIYSQLHQNIQDKFNEGGVEIMSPHYSALRDGNAVTLPSSHLPKSYVAPAFRVQQNGSAAGKS